MSFAVNYKEHTSWRASDNLARRLSHEERNKKLIRILAEMK
jgi:hypothetical protein